MRDKYNIAFNGQATISQDINQAKKKAQILMKLTDTQVETFFSGQKTYIKKGVTLEEAELIQAKLEEHGLIVLLEKIPAPPSNNPSVPNKKITNLAIDRNKRTIPEHEHDQEENKSSRYNYYDDQSMEAPIPATFGFHCDGRFGRLNFLNAQVRLLMAIFPLVAAYFAILEISPSGALSQIILITICVFYINFSYRTIVLRLHDLEKSGWFVFLFALFKVPHIGIPIVLLFSAYLILMPGSKDMNLFGPPSEKGSSLGGFAFSLLVPVLVASVFYIENQNSVKRKQIEESILLTQQLQNNIQNYYVDNKKLPAELDSLENADIPKNQAAILRTELTSNGNISIHYNLNIQREGYLTIAPVINGDIFMWHCSSSNLKNKLLPDKCRAEIENLIADNNNN